MNILQQLINGINSAKYDLTHFPPTTDAIKKQLTNDAMNLAMNYGPMAMSISKISNVPFNSVSKLSDSELWNKLGLYRWKTNDVPQKNVLLGEIPDNAATLNRFTKDVKLANDLLNHTQLFNEHPFLKDVKLQRDTSTYLSPQSGPFKSELHVNKPNKAKIIHELQHEIQDKNSLISTFDEMYDPYELSLADMLKIAPGWANDAKAIAAFKRNPGKAVYDRLSHEVQARAVEKRINMSPSELKAKSMYQTILEMGIPRSSILY